jgi:hypothetical protein
VTAADDLVARARRYATSAHQRISHQRKYTKQPYEVHLKSVATLVASVTDDAESVAAAWLHDTVEDTPATIEDIREEFGEGIASLVAELTDVSRPSDGNRAARKAIDRVHLGSASRRAKTVKLADLIDNCRDICRHDPRFARVFLAEMAELLDVLREGDERLMARARKVRDECAKRLGIAANELTQPALEEAHFRRLAAALFPGGRLLRLFAEAFTAQDIAEPLASFDRARQARDVGQIMTDRGLAVAGVRFRGELVGYTLRTDLAPEARHLTVRPFRVDQILDARAPLSDVAQALIRHDHCFVRAFGQIAGLISREDMQKPVVRMWLFGIVTIVEMALTEEVRRQHVDGGWRALLSESRLRKAEVLQQERSRRGQASDLLDCLQLGDKGEIAFRDPEVMDLFALDSRQAARRFLGDLESLRNNLAHGQDIVTYDWPQIARMVRSVGYLANSL